MSSRRIWHNSVNVNALMFLEAQHAQFLEMYTQSCVLRFHVILRHSVSRG